MKIYLLVIQEDTSRSDSDIYYDCPNAVAYTSKEDAINEKNKLVKAWESEHSDIGYDEITEDYAHFENCDGSYSYYYIKEQII